MCPDPVFPAAGFDLKDLNGLTLAFLGDAYYELLVREYVLTGSVGMVQDLHERTVSFSNAAFQAAAANALQPLLTETEAVYFKRGRNAHAGHVPKNKTQAQYHLATALEAVFGYLYVMGNAPRARELFRQIIQLNKEFQNGKN